MSRMTDAGPVQMGALLSRLRGLRTIRMSVYRVGDAGRSETFLERLDTTTMGTGGADMMHAVARFGPGRYVLRFSMGDDQEGLGVLTVTIPPPAAAEAEQQHRFIASGVLPSCNCPSSQTNTTCPIHGDAENRRVAEERLRAALAQPSPTAKECSGSIIGPDSCECGGEPVTCMYCGATFPAKHPHGCGGQPPSLRDLQARLPWPMDGYSADFLAGTDADRDFEHALLHVFKAAGKLVEAVEEFDHGANRHSFAPHRIDRYIADIVICAARMANTCPGTISPAATRIIDLAEIVEARIAEKNGGKGIRP